MSTGLAAIEPVLPRFALEQFPAVVPFADSKFRVCQMINGDGRLNRVNAIGPLLLSHEATAV